MSYVVEWPESVGMIKRRLERVRPAMQAYIDRGVYAGITTLIARRGKIVHAEQFGWRDKEARTPMSADAIFRLYSMTKPIICTALMTLLEEGRLRLFDPVAKYIPAFGATKVMEADGSLVDPTRPILVGDLMTHMSGLTYHFVEDCGLGKLYDRAKLMTPSVPLKTRSTISRGFRSPSSRDRAGDIASASTCRAHDRGRLRPPLGAFLRERLFEPLGMADTGFDVPGEGAGWRRCMAGPTSLLPGARLSAAVDAWSRGVNDRLDVSASYPVDSPDTFQRGGHGLFARPTIIGASPRCWPTAALRRSAHSWSQDARAHAR